MSSPARPPWLFWLVVAATLLAAGSRWAGLASLPPQAWIDELWFGLRARDLRETGEWVIFYKTFWGGVNPLMVWLTAAAQWLALDQVAVASRAVSTTAGVLTVPLAYACWREVWRPAAVPAQERAGLAAAAALVLANFYYTVNLSRIGTEPVVSLAATLFCVWQLRRALRTGSYASAAAAGLAAGVAQYLSPHARFILPLLGVYGLHALWLARPADRNRLWRQYAVVAGVAIAAAGPIIIFFLREPEWFFGRARVVTESMAQRGLAEALVDNIRLLSVAFSFVGYENARDNLAFRPLLDPLQSIGFYLGLAWLVRHRAQAAAQEVGLWLMVMLAPALATDSTASFNRMIGAAPAIALTAVLGWRVLWGWAQARWPGAYWRWVAVAWVAASLAWNGYDYFVRYATQPQLRTRFTITEVDLGRELAARAAAEPVWVGAIPEADREVYGLEWFLPGSGAQRLDLRQCLPLTSGRGTPATYLVWTERDQVSLPALRAAYPGAVVTQLAGEREAHWRELTRVEVPAGAEARLPAAAVEAVFAPGLRLVSYEQSAAAVRPGESVFLRLFWRAEAAPGEDLTALVHVGSGLPGQPPLVAQRDGQPCQGLYPTGRWRPGDVVPDGFAVTVPADAPPGRYPLIVGWYRFPSLERLPLQAAAEPLPDNRAVVGVLTVTAP